MIFRVRSEGILEHSVRSTKYKWKSLVILISTYFHRTSHKSVLQWENDSKV